MSTMDAANEGKRGSNSVPTSIEILSGDPPRMVVTVRGSAARAGFRA